MALIVEDGTGRADAESYISVAYADTFHAALGNDTWTDLSTTEKEQMLRRATNYLRHKYRLRWKGRPYNDTQALDWPRSNAWRDAYFIVRHDEIPREVKNATAELALKAYSETLAPDLERGVESEKIGSIQITYDKTTPQEKRFRIIDMELAPLLKGDGAALLMVRA